MRLVASLFVSIVLIATALTLYYFANRNFTIQSHYEASISLARQIQQLDASWSVETARVEADPLADFDSLAAFIPQMTRLKDELSDAVRRIPTIPAQLSNDVRSYVSALEAKEERVERFKTGYTVVRNSVRYLPLAATNLIRLVNEADDRRLAERVSRLTRDVNAYLTIPHASRAGTPHRPAGGTSRRKRDSPAPDRQFAGQLRGPRRCARCQESRHG